MKIQELEVTRLARRYAEPWAHVFHHYGWTLLGTGREAFVGLNPHKNYVLKIWRQPSHYNAYVDFVKSHPNPHYPRFFREPRSIPGTQFYYIALEKLEPVQNVIVKDFLPEMLWLGLTLLARKEYFQQRSGVETALNRLMNTKNISLEQLLRDPVLLNKVWNKIGQPPETWKTAVAQLEKLAIARKWYYDLADFNFMRWHDTLVITDPF